LKIFRKFQNFKIGADPRFSSPDSKIIADPHISHPDSNLEQIRAFDLRIQIISKLEQIRAFGVRTQTISLGADPHI